MFWSLTTLRGHRHRWKPPEKLGDEAWIVERVQLGQSYPSLGGRAVSSAAPPDSLLKKHSFCVYITYEENENKGSSVWPKSANQYVREAEHLEIPLMDFTLLIHVRPPLGAECLHTNQQILCLFP